MNLRPRRTWFLLLCLLAVALAIRVKAATLWDARASGEGFVFSDSKSYWTLGEGIAKERNYELIAYKRIDDQMHEEVSRAFRTPGYPLLLAALFRVADSGNGPFPNIVDVPIFTARVLSVSLGTLAVVAVYWLGRTLFDATVALVAAAIAAVYPGAIVMSVVVLSEAPFCPLLVAQLAAQVAAWQANTKTSVVGWSIGAGILAGAATLMRPSWLLFVPFAIVCGFAFSHHRVKHLLHGAWMLAALIAVMAPWWVRNYRVTDHFVPTSLQVGASLYDGLSPDATGASDMDFVWDFAAKQWRDPQTDANTFEYDLDRSFRSAALAYAREHPGRVLRLAGIKFTRMWNVWPNEPQFRSWPVRLAVFFSYVPIMALATWGAWRFRDRGWPCVLLWLPAVYLTLLHMIFVSSIRYREPAMLPLIVLAAGTAVSWWRSKRGIKPTNQVSTEGGMP